MRYAAILVLPLLFLCSCASQETRDDQPTAVSPAPADAEDPSGPAPAPEPEAEKQRLAVLDMEDTTGDIDAESLAQATDYLRVLVVQSQRFIVVSDEEKQALIRELRKESHGVQYDESQRVPLGQRVAANVALITTILKIQEEYILKAELIDLAQEAIIAGATEKFIPDTFQQAIEAIAQAVSTEKEAPGDTMVAAAAAQEAAPADIPADGGTAVAADYTGDDRHDHDGGGVNFVIINIVSSRHGHEPDPAYREATERRREREKERREQAEQPHHTGEPNDTAAQESAEKPVAIKPIQFTAPARKPIQFHTVKPRPSVTIGAQPAALTIHPRAVPKREDPPPVYTLPSKREKESAPSFRIEPKKSEPAFFKRAPSNEPQPIFKKETHTPSYQKSEPAASPRPVFTPSKSVTPAPSSSASSSKKKKKDDDDDEDKKKEEKKKPSKSNIFIPRKR